MYLLVWFCCGVIVGGLVTGFAAIRKITRLETWINNSRHIIDQPESRARLVQRPTDPIDPR
jgi:hypothetical protein